MKNVISRVPSVASLALSYSGGYALAGLDAAGVSPFSGAAWPPALLAAALVVAVALCVAVRPRAIVRTRTLRAFLVALCFALCGLARGVWDERMTNITAKRLEAFDAESPDYDRGGPVETRAVGVVTAFPSKLRDGTRFVLEMWSAGRGGHRDSWRRDRPRLLVTVRPRADVRYGDLLAVTGKLSLPTGPRNPGGFDYKTYLTSKRIHATLWTRPTHVRLIDQGYGAAAYSRVVCPIRRGIGGLIGRRLAGEPEALLRGLLLGDRSLMERDLRESLARAGVIHILAVSGLHAGFVALIFMGAARCAGASGSTAELTSAFGVCAYCAVVGFPASACRAAAMIGAYVFFRRLQRPGPPYASLAVAAFALSLARPQWISTPGFQLSFAAAAGVLGFKDCLKRFGERTGVARVPGGGYLLALFAASLGASATTWPLAAYHFGRAPLLFLLGNAVAVPLVGVVLAWGLAGVLLGTFSAAFCDWMFAACWAAARLLLAACRLVASIPWAAATVVSFSPWLIAAYLVALAASFSPRRCVKAAAVCCLLLISLLICTGAPGGAGRKCLEATFLDVGHGDACVMLTPTGESMLIDAGGATGSWNAGRDVILPFLRARGVRRLDRVVISHGDADHWGGLEEVWRGVAVKEVVLPRGAPLGALGDLVPKLESGGTPVHWAEAGDTLDALGGLECAVLHPSPEFERRWSAEMGERLNERSVVLRVSYGRSVFLMTGDIEKKAENWLAAIGAPLKCVVLKVPHHGSDTSSGAGFVGRASPVVAVVSCGPREIFNLPKPSVTARYDSLGAVQMLTVRDGAVIFRTDGTVLSARAFLEPNRAFDFDLGHVP